MPHLISQLGRSALPVSALTAAVVLFGLALSNPALAEQDAPSQITGAQTVDFKGVFDLISTTPNLVLVDSRKRADFDAGHIEGAINLLDSEMTEPGLSAVVKSKATPVLFYCNGVKCGRAGAATTKAIDWGYDHVYYYANGILEWKANDLPLVTR